MLVTYNAPYIIDATQDGDVAAAAGAPYTYAGEDIGERDREMGVTLVFRVSGVNWDSMCRYLTIKRGIGEIFNKSTSMGVSGNTAWGFSDEGYAYEPSDEAMRLRGFNMAKQDNGDVLVNALLIFDVDPLDEASREEGIARAEAELETSSLSCRTNSGALAIANSPAQRKISMCAKAATSPANTI